MPILVAQNISFETEQKILFKNLNLSLDNQITALVGPNGVGKTCLARILLGELQTSTGNIHRQGEVTYFPQRSEAPAVSVEDFLAFESWNLIVEELLFGVDRQKSCRLLSGGQWMRVRLAQALTQENFLILDEPTNDLDREGRQALLEFLREYRHGVLLISHDREALRLCDRFLELSEHGLSTFGGGWEAYARARRQEQKKRREVLERAKVERDKAHAQRNELKERQEKRNRQGQRDADRGGMPKILISARRRRAQVTTGKVEAETLERTQRAVREAHTALAQLKVDPLMYAEALGERIPAQKLIAEARDFNVRFHHWLYKDNLNFSWRGNLRLAIKGANGSGKSTLVKALVGENMETRGEFRRGSAKTLFVDQTFTSLQDSLSILENIREASGKDESEIRNGLAQFLFTKEKVFQRVSTLSGGERLRAALAQGLLNVEKPELLILDEPTNNLDLANIEFLENLLREFHGAFILISHDEEFLKNAGVTHEFFLT